MLCKRMRVNLMTSKVTSNYSNQIENAQTCTKVKEKIHTDLIRNKKTMTGAYAIV